MAERLPRQYSKKLVIPYPTKSTLKTTNASINLFNKDVEIFEDRLEELQSCIRRQAEKNKDFAEELKEYPSLFSNLPSLYIAPFKNVYEEKNKIVTDSRTGEEYLKDTDTGLLHYLKSNFVCDLEIRDISLPVGTEKFEIVRGKLFLLSLDNRSIDAFNLRKAFELGAWIFRAEEIYKANKEGLKTGRPFREWCSKEVKLSKNYISTLKQFYQHIKPYQKLLQCSIPLKFILTNFRRFVKIVCADEAERVFWSTG